jgi:hypothetical protein
MLSLVNSGFILTDDTLIDSAQPGLARHWVPLTLVLSPEAKFYPRGYRLTRFLYTLVERVSVSRCPIEMS